MTRQHGGLGIGLSIARALVEAQGGRLWASSPGLNQGAVFTFAFPIAKNA
jgi:signal transduction histidine kinase